MDTRRTSITKGGLRATLALAAAGLAAGCATVGGRLPTQREVGAHAAAESPTAVRVNLLHSRGSVYDAIVSMRPEFLRPRPSARNPHAPVIPAVFLDGAWLDDLSTLRQIPATWVAELRFLSSQEAALRFGRNYEAGVLIVTTKR